MAFGFFRRHQKAVIVIMCVLMVAFLLTYTTFETLLNFFSPSQNPVRGTAHGEKITAKDIQTAAVELEWLKKILVNRNQNQERITLLPHQVASDDQMLQLLLRNGRNAEEAFALLKAEARRAGVGVSEQEVHDALASLNPTVVTGSPQNDDVYRYFMQNLSKDQVRNMMTDWLMVSKNFTANVPAISPSLAEIRRLFSEVNDRIDLRMIQLTVNPAQVAQNPTDPQALELFKKYSDVLAGGYTKDNPFGFGYRKPDRASLEWLEIRDDMIRRVAQPTDRQIEDYYVAHRDDFEGKQPYEVRPNIAALLSEGSAQTKLDSVTSSVTMEVKSVIAQKGVKDIYPTVIANMRTSADGILGRKVTVDLRAIELRNAMEKLGAAGNVKIVYPMGHLGMTTISDEIKVTLKADQMTLGQALQQITDQIPNFNVAPTTSSAPASAPATPGKKINWCGLKGLNDVIFADNSDDLNTFPLRAYSTPGALSFPEFQRMYPELTRAITSENLAQGQGRPMMQEVFYAKPFAPAGTEPQPGALDVGQTGPVVFIYDPMSLYYSIGSPHPIARIIWNISEALPSHVPTEAEFAKDFSLRLDVQSDWKLLQAWQQTLDRAKVLVERARIEGIDAAATSVGQTVSDTGFFSRRTRDPQTGQVFSSWIPGVPMPNNKMPELLQDQIVDQAFVMAPKQIDGPYTDKAFGIIQVQPSHMIVVAQRKGFERAVQSSFDMPDVKVAYSQYIRGQYVQLSAQTWFNMSFIEKRADWKPEKAEKKVVGEEQ